MVKVGNTFHHKVIISFKINNVFSLEQEKVTYPNMLEYKKLKMTSTFTFLKHACTQFWHCAIMVVVSSIWIDRFSCV